MKSFVKNILLICCMLIISDAAIAQQQAGTADISITTLALTAVTRSQKVLAISNSENPGSRPVTIKAVVTVLNASLSPNGKVINERGTSAWPGYVQFYPLLIGANQSETFEFTFNKSTLANNISAFAFSTVPDANSENNYKTASY